MLCAAALSLSSAQFAAAMPLGTHDDDGDGRTLARSRTCSRRRRARWATTCVLPRSEGSWLCVGRARVRPQHARGVRTNHRSPLGKTSRRFLGLMPATNCTSCNKADVSLERLTLLSELDHHNSPYSQFNPNSFGLRYARRTSLALVTTKERVNMCDVGCNRSVQRAIEEKLLGSFLTAPTASTTQPCCWSPILICHRPAPCRRQ